MTASAEGRTYETASVEETIALGEGLGRALIGGITIGLVGPLGAGKTQLVKGIAAGNAVDDVRRVTSPTFTLVNEYPGTLVLYHLDAYRLKGPRELLALGFDEFVTAESAVVIEWADRVRPVMPEDTLWVEFALTGDTNRRLTFRAAGDISNSCLTAVPLPGRGGT